MKTASSLNHHSETFMRIDFYLTRTKSRDGNIYKERREYDADWKKQVYYNIPQLHESGERIPGATRGRRAI